MKKMHLIIGALGLLIMSNAVSGPYCDQMVKLAEGVGINHDKGYPASLFRDPMLERPDMMKIFYPALTMQDALGMINMVYDNNYGAEQARSVVASACAKLEPKGLRLFDKAAN